MLPRPESSCVATEARVPFPVQRGHTAVLRQHRSKRLHVCNLLEGRVCQCYSRRPGRNESWLVLHDTKGVVMLPFPADDRTVRARPLVSMGSAIVQSAATRHAAARTSSASVVKPLRTCAAGQGGSCDCRFLALKKQTLPHIEDKQRTTQHPQRGDTVGICCIELQHNQSTVESVTASCQARSQ